MRKSHLWIEAVEVKCPYCRKTFINIGEAGDEGDIVKCHHCNRDFELGEQ